MVVGCAFVLLLGSPADIRLSILPIDNFHFPTSKILHVYTIYLRPTRLLHLASFRSHPPGKEGDADLVCQLYEGLQNLIDGAWESCRVCDVLIDRVKQEIDGQAAVWLKSHTLRDSSDDKPSQTRIRSSSSLHTDATFILVRVDDCHHTSGSFFAIFGAAF